MISGLETLPITENMYQRQSTNRMTWYNWDCVAVDLVHKDIAFEYLKRDSSISWAWSGLCPSRSGNTYKNCVYIYVRDKSDMLALKLVVDCYDIKHESGIA